MNKSNRQRRTTMVVSTLIAAAILGAAVTAQHGHRQPLSKLAETESDLRMQLQMAFRHDTAQYEARVGQLDQVLDAWLQSSRSPTDRHLLTQWLQQAIRGSMPGSTQPLPPWPVFSSQASRNLPPENTTPDSPTPGAVDNRPLALPPPLKIVRNDLTQGKAPVAPSAPASGKIPATTAAPAPPVPVASPPPSPKSASVPSHETSSRRPQPSSRHDPRGTAPPKTTPRTAVARFTASSTAGLQSVPRMVVSPQEARPADEVAINLSELAARTAGYHDGLNEIEAALFLFDQSNGKRGGNWQQLSSAQRSLGQLRQLVDDYLFLKLYYGLLKVKQRQKVTAPQSPALLCERFSHCLDQWDTPPKDDYLRWFDQNLPESQQAVLQSLRADLAALATRIGN